MQTIQSYYPYVTPHGLLTIAATSSGIARVAFGDVRLDAPRKPCALTNDAVTEVLEYFAGLRRAFDVPLDLSGTDFQLAVWSAVARIPYGETTTSAEIARALAVPGSHRAVGSAVRANPAPVLVPTHRVIGANGRPLAHEAAPNAFAGLRRLEADVRSNGHGAPRQ